MLERELGDALPSAPLHMVKTSAWQAPVSAPHIFIDGLLLTEGGEEKRRWQL